MEEIKSLKVLSGLQEAVDPAYTWIIHLRNCMASYAGTIIDYKEKEFIRKLFDALYVVIKDETSDNGKNVEQYQATHELTIELKEEV